MLDQDAVGCPFEILELSDLQRPEKGGESGQTHEERDWQQDRNARHFVDLASLREFAMTISELVDIAAAASKGVTKPRIARGTASAL